MRAGLGLAGVLLCAISRADAQAGSPSQDGSPTPAPGEAKPGPAAHQASKPEDGFRVGGFLFKPGGRIKLDMIRDFDPIGSEDFFDTRTIPVDGSEGGNSNLHAKETRLFLDTRGQVEGRELKMYIEMDFYGSSSTVRLRHAYGAYGGLLAGQTWSTFVDDANIPNTIDFETPTAYPLTRQAQLRWTQKLGASASWAVALEDNKSSIVEPDVPGEAEYPMPDLVTRLKFEGSRGHVSASGFLGTASFRPTGEDPDKVTLWGAMLSGKLKTFGRDYAYAQVTVGDGAGRYRGGVTAVPDASGHLQAVGVVGFMGGYEHFWSDRWSSNGVYSLAEISDEDFYEDSFNKRLDYAAVNLLYWFLKDRAWTGIEYLYGSREVFGGDSGTVSRIHFAVRFNFPI
jgi:hypothetical protein